MSVIRRLGLYFKLMGFLDSLKKLFGGGKEQAGESQAQAPEQAPVSEGAEEQAPEQTEDQEEQRSPGGSGV